MISQTDYEFVLQNKKPKIRNEFIKSIDLGEYNEYIKKVKYIPKINKKEEFYGTTIKQLGFLIYYMKIPRLKSKLLVYPNAFNNKIHPNLEDFTGDLKHHEGFHAKEIFELNPLMVNLPYVFYPFGEIIYEARRELRAINNQIKNINEKNSEVYIDNLYKDAKFLEENIINQLD